MKLAAGSEWAARANKAPFCTAYIACHGGLRLSSAHDHGGIGIKPIRQDDPQRAHFFFYLDNSGMWHLTSQSCKCVAQDGGPSSFALKALEAL